TGNPRSSNLGKEAALRKALRSFNDAHCRYPQAPACLGFVRVEATQSHAVDGIVAYSAICAHAACPVSEWVKAEQGNKTVLKCPCHNSEYDPGQNAEVVFGPAPRRLAALPLAITDGALVVAGSFIGKVGGQSGG
ncbi:Rieske (2Fe-2S) protein, partial [Bradyrhizobium sp. NAS80.1]|uniref:QcrA and Rieske domain-containing protein n=1 Tax=Bradyrhizobium sp. NAS80.1 TaxID=1680159 RepID=UPI001160E4C9